MKKLISIVALLLAVVACYFGCKKPEETGTIYGTVTDYATGEPVKNANVTLRPEGTTIQTGSDGSYIFQELKHGQYSLFLSKAEYEDLTVNDIELDAGQIMCRDVQMTKRAATLRVTDLLGDDITVLDFGIEQSVTSKSFNIFNNGTVSVTCSLSHNCNWIVSVPSETESIASGQTKTIVVEIGRELLASGLNTTILHITSNNGSAELEIRAEGIGEASVTTANATNITASTATCGGNVTSDGGSAVTERGVCWSLTQSPSLENGSHMSMGSGSGSFSNTITGLTANTPYYVRAYAINGYGTSYGDQKMFTTSDGMPTVTTTAASNISANSATSGGNVTGNGGFQVTARGICWNTTGYPDLNDTHTTNGSGNGSFTANMTGLSPNTTYHVRAYATNGTGTAYGQDMTFTTADGMPTVTTTTPTKNGTTVTSGGNVTSDGGYAVTARGVCWSTSPYPDLSASHTHTSDGSGTGSFSSTFEMPGQGTYYVRAYATNANGPSYGEQKEISHPYNDLPTFTYGGQTYRVAPAASTTMTWNDADSYCNNLTLYGYSDWRLPSKDELEQMYYYRNTIGGFNQDNWWCFTQCQSYTSGGDFVGHYAVWMATYQGSASCVPNENLYYVRPIRIDN